MSDHPRAALLERIFAVRGPEDFPALALDIFRWQVGNNPLYHDFVNALRVAPENVQSIEEIPFLPIEFFKNHAVRSGNFSPDILFTSSGTTGMEVSTHAVRDRQCYERSFLSAFRHFYGSVRDYRIFALLPSYLEREGSSLVYMADRLIRDSGHPESAFFLHDQSKLAETLRQCEARGQRSLLLGVTFALLDFAEYHPQPLRHTIIMETGGMKGRREELTREEVHGRLMHAFGLAEVHSEYGMTELLSQAYSRGNGKFHCPPWMQVKIRETTDPLSPARPGSSGGINVIDLANLDSCAFIATGDLGRSFPDGSFEVLGRFDQADVRGCNLLVS